MLLILKRVLNKRDHRAWTGLTFLSEVVGGLVCKCGNETLGVLKLDVFLSKCKLLIFKKYSALEN